MTRRPRGPWIETTLLTAAVFGVLAVWSLTTPLYSTVDEPRHINSVLRLVEGGGWPEPKSAPILEAVDVGARESARPLGETEVPGAARAPGEPAPTPDTPLAPAERSSLAGVEGPPAGKVPKLDWMTQHPPGYYALLAGAAVVTDAHDWRWDHAVVLLRLLSAAMAAATVPFVMAAARMLTGRRSAALAGGAFVLAVPQWANVHSLVTNDALMSLLSVMLIFFGLRAALRPGTLLSSSLLGGLTLGLGLLTKGLMLLAVPVLALLLLVAGWRAGRSWRHRFWIPLAGGVVAFAVGGWWYVRNLLVFGTLQPSNYGSGQNAQAHPDYSLGRYLEIAPRKLVDTFWGSVRPSLDLPPWLVVGASLTTLLAILAAVILSRHRVALLSTFLLPTLLGALIVYHGWELYWNFAIIAGVQGRYLFSVTLAVALCVATVWAAVLRARVAIVVLAVVAALAMVVVPAGIWRFSQTRLWPAGWDAMLAQSAVGPGGFVTVLALAATALVASAIALVVLSSAESGSREPDRAPNHRADGATADPLAASTPY